MGVSPYMFDLKLNYRRFTIIMIEDLVKRVETKVWR